MSADTDRSNYWVEINAPFVYIKLGVEDEEDLSMLKEVLGIVWKRLPNKPIPEEQQEE